MIQGRIKRTSDYVIPEYGYKLVFNDGEEIPLYYGHHLAKKIGRDKQTIIRWGLSGILPETDFKDLWNFTLYTYDQMELIHRIVKIYNLGYSHGVISYFDDVKRDLKIYMEELSAQYRKRGYTVVRKRKETYAFSENRRSENNLHGKVSNRRRRESV